MSGFTYSLVGSPTALCVYQSCNRLKMLRIGTGPIATEVIYLKTLRYRTNTLFVRPSMNASHSARSICVTSNREQAVSVLVLCFLPLPTSAGSYNDRFQEPFAI